MSARGSIQDFGPFIVASGFEDALTLWDALRAFYLQRRPIRSTWTALYPETTVSDVQQVVGILTAEAEKLPQDALGRAAAVERWNRYRAEVQAASGGLLMFDAFPDNRRFWIEESRAFALDLATAATLPTKSDVVLDAIRAGVSGSARLGSGSQPGVYEDASLAGASATLQGTTDVPLLPDGIDAVFDDVAGAVEDAVGVVKRGATGALEVGKDVAGGAKDLLKSAVGGVTDAVVSPVVDGVGKPLLIGAAIVGGLLLVPRVLDGKKRRAA